MDTQLRGPLNSLHALHGNKLLLRLLTHTYTLALHVLLALRSLGLLRLQTVVKHLHGHVDVAGLSGDGHKALVGVGSLAGAGRSAGLRDADLAVGLGADLVDLDTGLANDCLSAWNSYAPSCAQVRGTHWHQRASWG